MAWQAINPVQQKYATPVLEIKYCIFYITIKFWFWANMQNLGGKEHGDYLIMTEALLSKGLVLTAREKR